MITMTVRFDSATMVETFALAPDLTNLGGTAFSAPVDATTG